jgi:RES domain-containing protein
MASRYNGPLRAFRIARARFELFDGSGAAREGARWSSAGQRVIYAPESFATALLETLVHSNLGRVPKGFAFIEIQIPEQVEIEEITPDDLPGWDEPDCEKSREFGGGWYEEKRTAVLVVPSVASSGRQRNVLIHQEHTQFQLLSASAPQLVTWDSRLFHRRRPRRRPAK